MKKLMTMSILLFFGCKKEEVKAETKLECSIQLTTLLLPVGNMETKEIRGVYTPEELTQILKGYNLYLLNCVNLNK